MIAARLHKEKAVCILLVLEPGNLEKLEKGEPIHKFLNEFIPDLKTPVELLLAYTPDAVWVAEQMKHCPNDAQRLAEIVEKSLSRKPVLVRDRTAEEMKRVF